MEKQFCDEERDYISISKVEYKNLVRTSANVDILCELIVNSTFYVTVENILSIFGKKDLLECFMKKEEESKDEMRKHMEDNFFD